MPTTLYLMLGYPGSGKTTAALEISKVTGATHLWADHVRRQMFSEPTYSHTENMALYEAMNRQARSLLTEGQSVVFDTNFSYQRDREILRTIADELDAVTVLVWVQAPVAIARERATNNAHTQDTRVLGNMSITDFERLRSRLEEPTSSEPYLLFDGTKITTEYIREKLAVTP